MTRDEVVLFAEQMERVLKENDYKGGWKQASPMWLFLRLEDEVRELRETMVYSIGDEEEAAKNIIKEAVDAANFCMMIADVIMNKAAEELK